MAVRVDVITSRYKDRVYSGALLRESYREGGKLRHRTLANLSALPDDIIEIIKRSLKGETFVPAAKAFRIAHSRSHGSVWAVWQMMKALDLPGLIGGKSEPWHDRVLGMILARVIAASSKRFVSRWWQGTSLPKWLPGASDVSVQTLYEAMDQLVSRQRSIEKKLARRHLDGGSLVLFDITSSYVEGRRCSLSSYGYNRDGKKGKRQIVWGLLTNREGCPVAVEVFPGNTRDPQALTCQADRIRNEFGLKDVIIAGDRGMITRVHRQMLSDKGYAWITALRASQICKLRQNGALQLSVFDERDLMETRDPDNPDRRLVLCRNWKVAGERRRKREDLLQTTEKLLGKIQDRVSRGRLRDEQKIALAVGKVIDRFRVAKHFDIVIDQGKFEFTKKEDAIAKEAALDGIYVIETNASPLQMSAHEAVTGYKSLQHVERAFRTMKTMALELRPIYHRRSDRVRAHAFLCMLSYYVYWHMAKALAPLRKSQPETYQSMRHVISRLGEIQLNTALVQGMTFDIVTDPDAEQQLFLNHLGVQTLLPKTTTIQKA